MIVELAIEVPQNEREKSEIKGVFVSFVKFLRTLFYIERPWRLFLNIITKIFENTMLHSTFDYGKYIGENDVDMVEVLCYIVILTGLFLIT